MKHAFVALIGGLALLVPYAASAEDCPNPKTCGNYQLENTGDGYARWETDENGIASIPYFINPSGQTPFAGNPLRAEHVIGAANAAFRTWQSWNPRLRFIYKGTTDASPGFSWERDGKSVIGFRDSFTALAHAETHRSNSTIIEADIWLSSYTAWSWRPCEQRDNSCTRGFYSREWITATEMAVVNTSEYDLQAILTHEIGHLLGLKHPNSGTKSYRLTMADGAGSEDPEWQGGGDVRHLSTLGLGDVLGVKVLYPWACPTLKSGQSYPTAYRYVCPTIKIFSP